jgi:sucrose phosphorylase
MRLSANQFRTGKAASVHSTETAAAAARARLEECLLRVYGPADGRDALTRIDESLARLAVRPKRSRAAREYSPSDILLISDPDQLQEAGRAPLAVLEDFCRRRLTGLVNGVHILPCFPSTSDGGFAVSDYRAVDPALGGWDDLARLASRFDLMLDAVINHTSARHPWFRAFLRDEDPGRGYYIAVGPEDDLSRVVRPRDLPLTHVFGTHTVWTTFSADQVDLNYRNPRVLAEAIDLLLYYAGRGARYLRLDAVAYLWKEFGTDCIHREQTHLLIRAMRAALELAAPEVRLVTETNVPHADNVSYWGNGEDEAHLIYNFTLPPLVLHTFRTGDARPLSAWAAGLAAPSRSTTFLNFLASHDGVGLTPLRGILPEGEIDALVRQTLSHGGLVSYKKDGSGKRIPYELNINYYDALNDPGSDEPEALAADRFRTAHAIMLALAGIPALYFHSLVGSRGWKEGPGRTGSNRSVNREKMEAAALEREMEREGGLRKAVFDRLSTLLRARARSAAFSPRSRQEILDFGPALFAVRRTGTDPQDDVLCLHNVTSRLAPFPPEGMVPPTGFRPGEPVLDRITDRRYPKGIPPSWSLQPLETVWLQPWTPRPETPAERPPTA